VASFDPQTLFPLKDPPFVVRDGGAQNQPDGALTLTDREAATAGEPVAIAAYLAQKVQEGVRVISAGSNHDFEPFETQLQLIERIGQIKDKKAVLAVELPAKDFPQTQALLDAHNANPNHMKEGERVAAFRTALEQDLKAVYDFSDEQMKLPTVQSFVDQHTHLFNRVYRVKGRIALVDQPFSQQRSSAQPTLDEAQNRNTFMADAMKTLLESDPQVVVVAALGRFHTNTGCGDYMRALVGEQVCRLETAGMLLEKTYGERHLSVNFLPSSASVVAYEQSTGQRAQEEHFTYDFGAWEQHIVFQEP
jgi:hypothetical protein